MERNQWYQMSAEDALREHRVQAGQGLSWEEARERQRLFGPNELAERAHNSPLTLFLNQFKDFMVLVLMAATLISGLLGEYLDAITIVAIIVLNGVLGFIQEFRAERSLSALKELSAPMAKVIREGAMVHIQAKELVPGDIVVLESGDRIPADIRFLETNRLFAEESSLTGESVPVNKHAEPLAGEDIPLGDQKNIGFMGTLVTGGSGKGVVIRTGMNTEMGKIADLIQNAEAM